MSDFDKLFALKPIQESVYIPEIDTTFRVVGLPDKERMALINKATKGSGLKAKTDTRLLRVYALAECLRTQDGEKMTPEQIAKLSDLPAPIFDALYEPVGRVAGLVATPNDEDGNPTSAGGSGDDKSASSTTS